MVDHDEEEMAELTALAEMEPDELEAELEGARESLLEELRELLDDYMQGEETAEETRAELQEDLDEWDQECADNPFLPDFPDLAEAWGEATDIISDGYNLMIMGIDRGQPEFLQEGYLMVEDGLFRRDAVLQQG